MVSKIFMTFGSQRYAHCIQRICKEAENIQVFDEILGFTETHLKNDHTFWNRHGHFIENNPIGYGYWIWKSYLILNKLQQMNENDFLVYCDSGCEVNADGRQRLLEYMDMLDNNKNNYGIISFELEHMEKCWTKRSVFEYFHCNDDIIHSNQFVGGILVIKKNSHAVDLIKRWCEAACQYNLLNDVRSFDEYTEFISNRHDQSIFSILRKLHGSIVLKDETYFHHWVGAETYPLLAKRNKG